MLCILLEIIEIFATQAYIDVTVIMISVAGSQVEEKQ